jgi:uncharacterized protein YqeY
MSLRETIATEVKIAMKERNMEKVNALRLVQSAFKNREIELRPNPMSEEEHLTVIRKLVKQRKESIEQYTQANRKDLADAEAKELVLLEHYLPQQMGREQIEKIVTEVIAEMGATSAKQMGQVMKEVQVRTQGSADNKLVSELIKSKLN